MYNNYDYPCGADGPNAPWNQVDNPEREIEVTVSITLSKTLKIEVSDYTVDSNGDIDYSDCNLRDAVERQVILPQNAYNYINPYIFKTHNIVSDLYGWNVDEMEIIKE